MKCVKAGPPFNKMCFMSSKKNFYEILMIILINIKKVILLLQRLGGDTESRLVATLLCA